jgi:hypothetical protein
MDGSHLPLWGGGPPQTPRPFERTHYMPHPDGLAYGVDDVPPPAKLLLLGLQQTLVLAMYLVC